MNFVKLFILFIILFIFSAFGGATFGASKIIYPNETPLQTVNKDNAPNTQSGMNTQDAKININNLDSSLQTLDSQKLTENIKINKSSLIKNVKDSSILIWVISILLIILLMIFALRQFQKK